MNIEDLTLKQIREIAALAVPFAGVNPSAPNPMIGQYVIARCYSAGVHAGTVQSVDGENVVLANSRRLWSWKAKDGVALSGVAQHGIKSECKIDSINPSIYLTGVCELIPATKAVQEQIHAYK